MPTVNGHASADIRDLFVDAIEAFEGWDDSEPAPTLDANGRTLTIANVCGLLWNCTDTMPAIWCNSIARLQPDDETPVRKGASYAQGARALRALVLARCPLPA